MALTGTQYQSMRLKFRGLLSNPNSFVSEAELNSFIFQLAIDASSATPLSGTQQGVVDAYLATTLAAPAYIPRSTDPPLFFAQAVTDSGGANALTQARYQTLKNQFTGALSYAGVRTEAQMLGYFSVYGTAAPTTPLTLPGNAAVSAWLRADKGITLGSNLISSNTGAMAIAGMLAQATAVKVTVQATGTESTCVLSVSVNGGTTYLVNPNDSSQLFTPAQASAALLSAAGLSLSLAAATYNAGDLHESCVAQWVDQKAGFIFAQATPSQRPRLNYSRAGGQLSVHFDSARSTYLSCAAAGVAAPFNRTNADFSIYIGMRSGAAAGTNGILSAGATGTAGAFWQLYNSGTSWGTFSGSGGNAGTITADTTYGDVEYFTTGTAETLIANGTVVKNAVGQSLNLSSAVDTVIIGATGVNAIAGNFGDQYIDEIVLYNTNNHAVSSPSVPAYLTARYVDLASTAIPDASIADKFMRAQGLFPPTDVPNDYRNSAGFYDRIRVTVPAGTTALSIDAVNGQVPGEVSNFISSVIPWVDNVFTAQINYPQVLGLKQTQTLSLDGGAHTIDLEGSASVVAVRGVGGAATIVAPAAPNTRVFRWGDSITYGFGASTHGKCASLLVRHGLSATYGVKLWGVIGQTAFNYFNSSGAANAYAALVQPEMDGSAKNIIDIQLGTNDMAAGVTPANLGIYLQNAITALRAVMPSVEIVLSNIILRSGYTTTTWNAAIASVVTANSSFTTLNDRSAQPFGGDGIHPSDATYASLAANEIALYQTL